MSLEQVITENTTTMRELIDAMSRYVAIFGQQTPDPKPASVETNPAPLLPESETKPAVAEVKPKPKPEPKPEPEPKPAVAEAKPAVAEAKPAVAEPKPEQEPIPSEQEAIRCLMELAKKDRTRAVAILAQFSVSKASELKEPQRAEFIAAVNLKLNELEDK